MGFEKWWPCPKKHTKRLRYLLPHARRLKANLNSARPFRYFTLCGPPMIDIFMLARDGVLQYDESHHAIDTVVFCEYDEQLVPLMRELVGREDSGFEGQLEDLVLFEDTAFTAQFPDLKAIENYTNEKGESLPPEERNILQRKTDQLEIQRFFPFDFINLDFCDPYYPEPPDIMKVSNTVARILEWQGRLRTDVKPRRLGKIDEFVMAVTCRFDDSLPQQAETRLKNIVKSNCDQFPTYRGQVARSRQSKIDDWAKAANLDFFLAGWPKDIAKRANDLQWNVEILDYVHYSRKNEAGQVYEMVCLVCGFKRTRLTTGYLELALKALDKDQRIKINPINLDAADGKILMADLAATVALRNVHAQSASRDVLPNPIDAIREFTAQGIEY
jgi:hypothetical protein